MDFWELPPIKVVKHAGPLHSMSFLQYGFRLVPRLLVHLAAESWPDEKFPITRHTKFTENGTAQIDWRVFFFRRMHVYEQLSYQVSQSKYHTRVNSNWMFHRLLHWQYSVFYQEQLHRYHRKILCLKQCRLSQTQNKENCIIRFGSWFKKSGEFALLR